MIIYPKVRLTKEGLRGLKFHGSMKKQPAANDRERAKEAKPELVSDQAHKDTQEVVR